MTKLVRLEPRVDVLRARAVLKHALRRHVRSEEERQPSDLHLVLGLALRLLEIALLQASETKRESAAGHGAVRCTG